MSTKRLKEIMRCKPNCLETFDHLMILGNTLHETTGKNYFVNLNMKEDCIILLVEVERE